MTLKEHNLKRWQEKQRLQQESRAKKRARNNCTAEELKSVIAKINEE